MYIWGCVKIRVGSDRGNPDVRNGLDQRFGMDRGYGSACGFRVWIGALHFDSQPYIYIYTLYIIYYNLTSSVSYQELGSVGSVIPETVL